MSTTNEAVPAFPAAGMTGLGMTLRDYFVAKAMQVLLPKLIDEWDEANRRDGRSSEEQASRGCRAAYKIADAMLQARQS